MDTQSQQDELREDGQTFAEMFEESLKPAHLAQGTQRIGKIEVDS